MSPWHVTSFGVAIIYQYALVTWRRRSDVKWTPLAVCITVATKGHRRWQRIVEEVESKPQAKPSQKTEITRAGVRTPTHPRLLGYVEPGGCDPHRGGDHERHRGADAQGPGAGLEDDDVPWP